MVFYMLLRGRDAVAGGASRHAQSIENGSWVVDSKRVEQLRNLSSYVYKSLSK